MRPKSIGLFERLYLASWVLGIINTLLSWDVMKTRALESAGGPDVASAMMPVLYGSVAIGMMIPPLLWFFIARRGSVIAKWVLVVLVSFALISFVLAFLRGAFLGNINTLIAIVALVLQFSAAAMLFRPDTKSWFGETPAPTAPSDEDVL